MRRPPPATDSATDTGRAVQSPPAGALGPVAARSGALPWLALSAQRTEEVAAELGQFAAATAAVRARLRFDSEPADWAVSCARWQQEPR